MPITKSAKKAQRVSARKRVFNLRRTGVMRSAIKKLQKLAESGNKKEAEEILPKVYKAIDKAKKRGIIKTNNAARKKSSASRLVKKISSK